MTRKIPEKLQTRLFENYTCTAVQDSRDIYYSCTKFSSISTHMDLQLYSSTAILGLCLNRPGRHPKNFRFRKFWRSYLDQN